MTWPKGSADVGMVGQEPMAGLWGRKSSERREGGRPCLQRGVNLEKGVRSGFTQCLGHKPGKGVGNLGNFVGKLEGGGDDC